MPVAIPCKSTKFSHIVQGAIHLNASEYHAWVEDRKNKPDELLTCPHCKESVEKRRKQTEFEALHRHKIDFCLQYPHSKICRKKK